MQIFMQILDWVVHNFLRGMFNKYAEQIHSLLLSKKNTARYNLRLFYNEMKLIWQHGLFKPCVSRTFSNIP